MPPDSTFAKKRIPPWPFAVLGCVALVTVGAWWHFTRRVTAPTATASTPIAGPTRSSTAEVAIVSSPAAAPAEEADLVARLRAKIAAGATAEEILALIHEIAKTRPALAIELAQSLSRTEEERAEWVIQVMKGWADRDPAQAWAWLKQQNNRIDELANGTLPQLVFDGMARKDPNILIDNINEIFRDGRQPPLVPVAPLVAVHLAMQSLVTSGKLEAAQQAVEEWLKVSKTEIGAAPIEAVAMAMGERSPDSAANWLQSLPKSEDRNFAIATYASDWCNRDPANAMAWVERLGPEEGRTEALERAFGGWVERQAAGAGEWLGDFLTRTPANAESDKMIMALINNSGTIRKDSAAALDWASLLADPKQRDQAVEGVMIRWARRDLFAATDHVMKDSSIPQERKQSLVQELQKAHATRADFIDE